MPERAIFGLDHAIVGVRDLAAAAQTWQRLGFTLSPRGRHIEWATANRCIMFPANYVELLGVADPDGYTHGLDRFLAEREGLLGFAFATEDEAGAHAHLDAAGLAGGPPTGLCRILESPEGEERPEFALVHPNGAGEMGLPWFVCRHLSAGIVRRPGWLRHANTACAIRALTMAPTLTPAAAKGYRRLFGADNVVPGPDGVTVRVGGAALRFVAAGPCRTGGVGMEIAATDLGRAAAVLTAAEVAFVRDGRGLHVDPEAATGVALSFVSPCGV